MDKNFIQQEVFICDMKTILMLSILFFHIAASAQGKQDAAHLDFETELNSEIVDESLPIISDKITAKVGHNELFENSKGMMIYPKFKVDNVKGKSIKLKVNLYQEGSDEPQCVENQTLQLNSDGNPFIFIPYCSLNLEKNKVHKIRFEIQAYCQGKLLKRSTSYRAIINML